MADTLLTSDIVTRKALRIAHQKANFLSTIDKQHDSTFAKTGAKIGDTLRIRKPNQYVVRSGAVMSAQDLAEDSVSLQIATQRGVDLNFTIKDLTLDIDDFATRILDPAVSVLVSNVESIVYASMVTDIYNMVDNDASAITFKNIMKGRQKLTDNLAPEDCQRTAMLGTGHTVTVVDALKALFQDSQAIKKQYREGMMGRTAGFEFRESTHVNDHTTGTAEETTTYLVNGAAESGSSIAIDTGSTTFLKGDVITIANVNRVHTETKVSTGAVQQFVVTADSGASATSLAISPALTATGAKQNVTNVPADNSAITKVGAGANELLNSTMVYHKDAFTFATADLLLPNGVDFASRKVFDGISLCCVRDYNIVNHTMPCRLDILFGYLSQRPEWASRIHADG